MRREGFVDTGSGKTWYKIAGAEKKATPLIVIHGGPAFPHDSLEPLEALSKKRPVIFYDQLGCGNSRRTDDKSVWTIGHFDHELKKLIQGLKLERYHLLGHSWGAVLGANQAIDRSPGLQSVVLSSPYLSTPLWEKDAKRLVAQLPQKDRDVLQNDAPDSEAYQAAEQKYYEKHVWGMSKEKLPKPVLISRSKMNHKIYEHMWGSNEFSVSGTLEKLDLREKLPRIKAPVLYLCGRFDEATPESTGILRRLTPGAEMTVFAASAHNGFHTEPEKYMKRVREFLAAHD